MESINARYNTEINLDRFKAINATNKKDDLSSKYQFASSKDIIEVLQDNNWYVTQAKQARVLKPENVGFQKHIVVLANKQFEQEIDVGGSLPRIMLKNSHDGKSSLQLISGIFEKICSNGLMVGNESATFKINHIAFTPQKLEEGIKHVQQELIKALEFSDKAKTITMDKDEERILAESAIELAFDGDQYSVRPESLLFRRHYQQKDANLWNTFNVIQENVIKGGVRQTRQDGTRIRSREVKNIDRNINLNKALWSLADKFYQLKTA